MTPVCDKCGERVPPINDAVNLEMATGNWSVFLASPRHLLPTETCEGSPSRAQYLEGQPRDSRSEYPYDPEYEEAFREAYRLMQERYA